MLLTSKSASNALKQSHTRTHTKYVTAPTRRYIDIVHATKFCIVTIVSDWEMCLVYYTMHRTSMDHNSCIYLHRTRPSVVLDYIFRKNYFGDN